MKAIMLILSLALFGGYDDTDGERLELFLKKLSRVQESQKDSPNKWPMPVYQPSPSSKMPQMKLGIVDSETGLEYSNSDNKIVDRALEFELDIASGTISDLKTGKKFSYKSLTEKNKQEG